MDAKRGGRMVGIVGPGYTPPEHVIKQADLSALQGIYKRYGNKSFDLMIEAIYRLGGEEAVVKLAVDVLAYWQDMGSKIKGFEEQIRRENQKVLY